MILLGFVHMREMLALLRDLVVTLLEKRIVALFSCLDNIKTMLIAVKKFIKATSYTFVFVHELYLRASFDCEVQFADSK